MFVFGNGVLDLLSAPGPSFLAPAAQTCSSPPRPRVSPRPGCTGKKNPKTRHGNKHKQERCTEPYTHKDKHSH